MLDPASTIGAVIVAGGSGSRFGSTAGIRKQYHELCSKPLLVWALEPFVGHPKIAETVVVLPKEDFDAPLEWLDRLPIVRAAGGAERSDSVRAGVAALQTGVDFVLVHDAARPLVRRELIDRVLAAGSWDTAVIPGVPIVDTIKEVRQDGSVVATVDRGSLRRIQTPQLFPRETLQRLHERALADGFRPSDDAGLFERYGLTVEVVEGDPDNLKVTTQTDFAVAEFLAYPLRRESRVSAGFRTSRDPGKE